MSLETKTIIHAIDLRNVNQESISIYIKTLEKGTERQSFTVKTDEPISGFITATLQELYDQKADDLLLVYVGKQLDHKKSWKEECV